uniref:Fibrinogen C-terminal domain-containing protein n=1 Tax=Anopheles atroparvus TaxID=41427 RepID=A0AAG5DGS7_ANOAO
MWRRLCFLALCAVICMAGVSSKPNEPTPDSRNVTGVDDYYTDDGAIEERLNSSCKEISSKVSGKYDIQLGKRFSVYCEQNAFGGGWIVFQHRMNGTVNFYRTWADYREGFGSLDGEFWLGLEILYQLTSSRTHELMVEMRDYQGNYGYAHYDQFIIGNESEGYSLEIGTYNGTAGDSLTYSSNGKFLTKDQEKDPSSFLHCAVHLQGAWWYKDCSQSNLNGIYGNLVYKDWIGMHWFGFKKDYRSMSYTRMMIRELD